MQMITCPDGCTLWTDALKADADAVHLSAIVTFLRKQLSDLKALLYVRPSVWKAMCTQSGA